ncbi:MAG: thioredoxin family protein [Rhodothermales bacterium]
MSVAYSEMIELGTHAPPFELPAANPSVDGKAMRSLDDFADAKALVVVFTCNHCPYARHVEEVLIKMACEYESHHVKFVAISSNDPDQYPDDSFESMSRRAVERNYPFPYLFDESQDVALAYGAVCTPDVFVFNRERELVYRGRIDSTRPGSGTASGDELRAAITELLEKGVVTVPQLPSMGCNIKWKPGKRPH